MARADQASLRPRIIPAGVTAATISVALAAWSSEADALLTGFAEGDEADWPTREPIRPAQHYQVSMKIFTRLAAAGLLGLLVLQPAQASDALQTRALKALFPGTFHAVIHGQDVTFLARRNGSLLARSGESTDTGEWSIRQGELCIMLASWLGGRTMCGQVIEHGDWYRVEYILFRKP